jgi:acyl carrier protein
MAAQTAPSLEPIDDPLVMDVIAVFEEVVGCRATPDDNLLSLGGDSTHAVTIALELEKRLQVGILVEAFEGTQTIRELAAWIAGQRGEETVSVAPA